uniref:Uncharacterized protein n=1 Tax=Tanacetum cinerariifolium TaxID=118510 RepID=A0A6L2P3K6_TANCI|nr:hypothetical protein [Tanacetum cinerariifolium]
MGDEHLNTIPATESDEFIKSCVVNLIPITSESEGENGCDVPAGFTTLSNPSAECPMIVNGKNTPVLDVPLFHFYPLDQTKCYSGCLNRGREKYLWYIYIISPWVSWGLTSAALSHVAKRTRYVMAQSFGSTTRPNLFADDSNAESDDDDASCYEIPLVTPIYFATVIPSSGNQGGGSATPAVEGPNT